MIVGHNPGFEDLLLHLADVGEQFYKDGSLLYELDHDYQIYDCGQTKDRKLLKRAYELHDKLKNKS